MDEETAAMSLKLQGDVRALIRDELRVAIQDELFWVSVMNFEPMGSRVSISMSLRRNMLHHIKNSIHT